MNIPQKRSFCTICSLKFDTSHVYGLHMKIVHKVSNPKKSNKTKPKSIVIGKKINHSAPGSQIFADLQPHFPRFVCILHTNLGKCDNGLGMEGGIDTMAWIWREGIGKFPLNPKAKKMNYSAPGSQIFADLQPHFPRFV